MCRIKCCNLPVKLLRSIISPFMEALFFIQWIVWLFSSIGLASGQTIVVLFTMFRITVCIILYIIVVTLRRIYTFISHCIFILTCISSKHIHQQYIPRLKSQLYNAKHYEEWRDIAAQLDKAYGFQKWKSLDTSDDYDYKLLKSQLNLLIKLRNENDVGALMFTLQNHFHRQYCNIESTKLYTTSLLGTKFLVEEYLCRVVEILSYICKRDDIGLTIKQKIRFFQRARKSYGKSALCLSGGGAFAMYHMGVIRTLIKNNCLPSVCNGTSGGSIVAGVLATRTLEELRDPNFLVETISNRYGVRWLPSLQSQVTRFLKYRTLMDDKEFAHTTRMYYGDLTFEEAYKRTGRDVSITVTYSSKGRSKAHAVVLNHITSPHVLVASAVTTSCALPGLMPSVPLLAKQYDGNIVEYVPQGMETLDGSLQSDIPMQRLTELFNAQNFIVSQVNPHVAPFLIPDGDKENFFNKCEKFLHSDISHRLIRLAKMKIIPKIYGQDFTGIFGDKQKYSGQINILPYISFKMQFKPLKHPDESDMREYFLEGERATWQKIHRIQNAMIIERTLDECIKVLQKKDKKLTEEYAIKIASQRNSLNIPHQSLVYNNSRSDLSQPGLPNDHPLNSLSNSNSQEDLVYISQHNDDNNSSSSNSTSENVSENSSDQENNNAEKSSHRKRKSHHHHHSHHNHNDSSSISSPTSSTYIPNSSPDASPFPIPSSLSSTSSITTFSLTSSVSSSDYPSSSSSSSSSSSLTSSSSLSSATTNPLHFSPGDIAEARYRFPSVVNEYLNIDDEDELEDYLSVHSPYNTAPTTPKQQSAGSAALQADNEIRHSVRQLFQSDSPI